MIGDDLFWKERDYDKRCAAKGSAEAWNPWRDLRQRLAWDRSGNYAAFMARMSAMDADIKRWKDLGRGRV